MFCNSCAGTGKTTIGVAAAKLLIKSGQYDELIYVISPCEEKALGYMPGDLDSKISLYALPLHQALIECGEQPERAIIQGSNNDNMNGGWVRFVPSTFLRGANLNKKIVFIDEAQNFPFHELKKTLTRVHDSCKLIVGGHDGQRDTCKDGESAFSKYLAHFDGQMRV